MMMNMKKIFVMLVALAAAILCSCSSAESASFTVTSSLRDTLPFEVTCWSKDNHLGPHVLYFDQSVHWHFSGLLWTKFWCNFEWRGLHMHQQVWGYYIVASTADFQWEVTVEGLFLKAFATEPAELFQLWRTRMNQSNVSEAGGSGSYNITVEAAGFSDGASDVYNKTGKTAPLSAP